MHTGIAGSIIDEHFSILVCNPSVGEQHVGYIAHAFLAFGYHESACGRGYHTGGIVQGGHVHIQHIAQTCGATAHAVRQMQPALGSLDGMGTFAVLHFLDGVVIALVDDGFLGYFRLGHVVHQRPADSASASRINESVLRAGI